MSDPREDVAYKQVLKRHNVIMLATVGSGSLGLQTKDDSDIDEMGVVLETPDQLLGFSPFEHEIYRTAEVRTGKVSAKSEPGDLDLALYGLRKYVRMVLGGNPNMVTLMYLPEKAFTTLTPLGKQLRGLREQFRSKLITKAFLGYAQSQRLKLEGLRGGKDVNRAELVQKHGYDTKFAMHALRLSMQGYEFAREGTISFPMSGDARDTLKAVRSGGFPLADTIQLIAKYERYAEDYSHVEGIPEKPNYDAIERWLVQTYREEWNKQ